MTAPYFKLLYWIILLNQLKHRLLHNNVIYTFIYIILYIPLFNFVSSYRTEIDHIFHGKTLVLFLHLCIFTIESFGLYVCTETELKSLPTTCPHPLPTPWYVCSPPLPHYLSSVSHATCYRWFSLCFLWFMIKLVDIKPGYWCRYLNNKVLTAWFINSQ